MQSISTTRRLLGLAAAATLLSARPARAAPAGAPATTQAAAIAHAKPPGTVRLLLTGDVMLGEFFRPGRRRPAACRRAPRQTEPSPCPPLQPGRGVDQALPFHCSPEIYEGAVRDARFYTQLAVAANGPLPEGRGPGYPWGVALADMEVRRLAGGRIHGRAQAGGLDGLECSWPDRHSAAAPAMRAHCPSLSSLGRPWRPTHAS